MNNFNPNLYDILGRISRHATDAEIKEAYRTLAKHYHPDKNPGDKAGAEEQMAKLNEAYAILKDPKKRAEYNAMLLAKDAELRQREEERAKKAAEDASRKSRRKPVNHSTSGEILAGVLLGVTALGLLFAALSDDD